MNDPRVSVVVPTYNRACTLPVALESVLDQTFPDFEVIIVDDGSTDNTAAIVSRFKDPRIHYLPLDRHCGANSARNAGIRYARGEYVAFQDSDDEWLPRKLEKQIAAFDRLPDCFGVVYCKYRKLSGSGSQRTFGQSFDRGQLLERNYIGTPTMVVRRQYLKQEPFDEQLLRRQDWELCLRLMQICQFHFVDEVLVLSPVSPSGITNDQFQLLRAYQHILEKHQSLIRSRRQALAHFYFTIGTLQIQESEWQLGRSHLLKAVRYWPLTVRYWVRALVSLFGRWLYLRLFSRQGVGERW